MAESQQILFTLRSNTGWESTDVLKSEIELQLKKSILLFDKIIVEDGTYVADIGPKGYSDLNLPPGNLPIEDRKIFINHQGRDGDVVVRWTDEQNPTKTSKLNFGKSIRSIKIDFHEILTQNFLDEQDFIERTTFSFEKLPLEAQQAINQESSKDSNLSEDLEKNQFLRNLICKNLNNDIVHSIIRNAPIFLDPEKTAFFERKSQNFNREFGFTPNKNEVVGREIIRVACPNFSNMSFEEVIELRSHRTWKDFRSLVRELVEKIERDPEIVSDPKHLSEMAHLAFSDKLLEQLIKNHPGQGNLGVDVILGGISLIPCISEASSAVGIIKSASQYFRNREGWITFIAKMRKN